MNDIHNYAGRLIRIEKLIQASRKIKEQNKLTIFRFRNYLVAQGLSKPRIEKYLRTLLLLGSLLSKNFEKTTKHDVIEIVGRVESKRWSGHTKHDFKVCVKRFYKWLRGIEKKGIYPDEVEWISTVMKNDNRLPEEILTEEEVKKLVQAANNPRDKALILVLYESGCRVGEFLPIKIRNVQFDEYGAVIMVNGKTGSRRIRLISSVPALANWIQHHPYRDNPEAEVWLSLATNRRYKPLNYRGLNKVLRHYANKCSITKRVNPHSFRHARATHLASKLTESQLKELMGWTMGSSMASIYVHLSGRDVDNALLELQGLKTQATNESKLKLKICPRCDERNSPDAKYCKRCALTLDVETLEWENRMMDELLRVPAVKRYLRNALKKNVTIMK